MYKSSCSFVEWATFSMNLPNGRPFDVAVLEVRPSPDFRIVQILERRGNNQQFSILRVPVI